MHAEAPLTAPHISPDPPIPPPSIEAILIHDALKSGNETSLSTPIITLSAQLKDRQSLVSIHNHEDAGHGIITKKFALLPSAAAEAACLIPNLHQPERGRNLTTVQQSFENLIALAIEREEEAYDFYMSAAEEAETQASTKLLRELAQQEIGHKEKLKAALKEDVCSTFGCTLEETRELSLGDYLKDIPLKPSSSPQEILIVAIKREEGAFQFYKSLSELTEDPNHRTVFETLAKEEQNHKQRLERMYDDIFQPDM